MSGEHSLRRELLEEICADRQLDFSAEQIDAAHAVLMRYRDELSRLRSINFDYLTVIEPAHALQWVREGGTSR
jgi:hypothetical protein